MNLVVAASGYKYFAPDGAEKMVFYVRAAQAALRFPAALPPVQPI